MFAPMVDHNATCSKFQESLVQRMTIKRCTKHYHTYRCFTTKRCFTQSRPQCNMLAISKDLWHSIEIFSVFLAISSGKNTYPAWVIIYNHQNLYNDSAHIINNDCVHFFLPDHVVVWIKNCTAFCPSAVSCAFFGLPFLLIPTNQFFFRYLYDFNVWYRFGKYSSLNTEFKDGWSCLTNKGATVRRH